MFGKAGSAFLLVILGWIMYQYTQTQLSLEGITNQALMEATVKTNEMLVWGHYLSIFVMIAAGILFILSIYSAIKIDRTHKRGVEEKGGTP